MEILRSAVTFADGGVSTAFARFCGPQPCGPLGSRRTSTRERLDWPPVLWTSTVSSLLICSAAQKMSVCYLERAIA